MHPLDASIYTKLNSMAEGLIRAEFPGSQTVQATAAEDLPAFAVVDLDYDGFTLTATRLTHSLALSAAATPTGWLAYCDRSVTQGQLGSFEVIGGTAPVLVMPAIGDASLGGYYAGVIDPAALNIDAADVSQTGQRFALIISPKEHEANMAAGENPPASAFSRWDGLTVQRTVLGLAGNYLTFDHCAGLSYPDDGASEWYLPSKDELELLYRNFKPSATSNYTGNDPGPYTFPSAVNARGENPSSDPVGAAYTAGAPPQTALVDFKDGGLQSLSFGGTDPDGRHWSSTGGQVNAFWWCHYVAHGWTAVIGNGATTCFVRPVRRVSLS